MARKTTYSRGKPSFDYGAERRRLRDMGPERVYILYGEEDYLRDSFLRELRTACVPEGTEAFNYRRLDGPALESAALREAAEAVPFLGERTLTEVRGFDINRTGGYDPDAFKKLVSDVPEWATLAFVFPPGYSPDNRLGAVKALKKAGRDICFDKPSDAELVRWIEREVKARGKGISPAAARHLMWVCGTRMNTLLPEIVKIAGAAAGDEVTEADIDAGAKKAPETTIFLLTDALSDGQYNKAASMLADILAEPDDAPQADIYMISEQFRRLYVTKVAQEHNLPDAYILECLPDMANKKFLLPRLKVSCARYSLARLTRAVRLCAECDYGMKTNGPEPEELLKELVLRLALDRDRREA